MSALESGDRSSDGANCQPLEHLHTRILPNYYNVLTPSHHFLNPRSVEDKVLALCFFFLLTRCVFIVHAFKLTRYLKVVRILCNLGRTQILWFQKVDENCNALGQNTSENNKKNKKKKIQAEKNVVVTEAEYVSNRNTTIELKVTLFLFKGRRPSWRHNRRCRQVDGIHSWR